MIQAKKYMEKAFWLLLAISPALDILNGIWVYVLSNGNGQMLSALHLADLPSMSPSLTVRMIFLVLMTAYVFVMKKKKAIIMFLGIGVTWVLTITGELLRHVDFSLMADIQYIVRFCYGLLVLVVYSAMIKEDGRSVEEIKASVDKLLTYSLFVLSLGVLVPYLLGMGFYTYADRMGYRGNRGFFYAGNDITAVMMLLLPVVLACWLQSKQIRKPSLAWMQAAASVGTFVSLMVIGTKTAYVAGIVTAIVMVIYAVVESVRSRRCALLIRVAIVAILVPVLMFLISVASPAVRGLKDAVITQITESREEPGTPVETPEPGTPVETPDPGEYAPPPPQSGSVVDTIKDSLSASDKLNDKEGLSSALFSGRTEKLKNVLAEFKKAMPFSLLVGLGRGSQNRIIEMDIMEVFFYYGVFGFITMLWLYLTQGFKVVVELFCSFSLNNLAVCTALALCVGFLFIAGHTLFSVTGGFYFAFLIVYARLFCSKEGVNTTIL